MHIARSNPQLSSNTIIITQRKLRGFPSDFVMNVMARALFNIAGYLLRISYITNLDFEGCEI